METQLWTKVKEFHGIQILRDPRTLECRILPVERTQPQKPETQTETIDPEMRKLAEDSFRLHQMQALPVVKPTEPTALMTLEEQVQHDWKSNPGIRKEFLTFGSYQSYKRAAVAGKVKTHAGIGGVNSRQGGMI